MHRDAAQPSINKAIRLNKSKQIPFEDGGDGGGGDNDG